MKPDFIRSTDTGSDTTMQEGHCVNNHMRGTMESSFIRKGRTTLRPWRLAGSSLILLALVALLLDIWWGNDRGLDPLQFVRRPANFQTRDDAALLGGWIEQVDNSWEVGKNHQRVRAAFRDIVSDARKATVRVLREDQQMALGTVVDADGFVLTKASEVIGNARVGNEGEATGKQKQSPLVCQLFDGRRRSAKIVGVSRTYDLAMLRIRGPNLTAVGRWNMTDAPAIGSLLATPHIADTPLAIGIVSSPQKQIDNNGVLGVQLAATDENSPAGAHVKLVMPHSAARKAGVESGDLIVSVDSEEIRGDIELVNAIRTRLPGEKLRLVVQREDQQIELEAVLGRRADLDQENLNFQSFIGGELSFRRSGFSKVLQHDTFLLPEHCGGPIVNLDGQVVGINIARAERVASYALPAATVVPIIDSLKSGGADWRMVGTESPTAVHTR